ncbi:helix-turn-helix transcriptional regulator [Azotobacter beijerinckii]|uniref:Predicted DNA-binding transcriptional regulator YafY, contains an HTH and WYL domains n=1 Tax=Azotobacter beijerinckii TaxID=170623 RepID=A0A1I4FYM8_9GAMM|nr:WYL domain-containing protein [Azotobacter beijerinckii]SFB54965.1 Predicted DNA-binding transcriptional regulator YafY, contains an HTH and WYL domains [Azotobacter beijerinckii]SFL23002.1 Predicted DNA-binding transcriptional regulator YafY, contains an HTH and WYL domains [Azotobacter beijerinckii]
MPLPMRPPKQVERTETKGNHERLVYRLAKMLYKLNLGESLDPAALAEDFKVNVRTIQRDLNERFADLPLNKVDGRYQLAPAFLGKLNLRDVERFAGLTGIRGLFPSLSSDFLRDIFDDRMQGALLVKSHHYEDISGRQKPFRELEKAIVSHRCIAFDYRRGESQKAYAGVEPYKLLNNHGIWYLAARDGEKLKTFTFSQIERLRMEDRQFQPDPAINRRLKEEDGIWFSEERREVVLKIAAEIAGYFKRRKLIANQVIEKELEDGGLILSARIGHANQVLPIVRYWIPHIRIISPESLQDELENDVRAYLAR